MTSRSIHVNPIARHKSLAMARHRCRSWYMAEWLEDHMAAIGSLNSKFGYLVDLG
jgi:hypothetical protein